MNAEASGSCFRLQRKHGLTKEDRIKTKWQFLVLPIAIIWDKAYIV
jgi:hypothetical protein